MACSRWRRSLFASERAFSAFFALASADLVDFSALALAAVAASKAFLEAASLASSDEMRALAIAKASIIQTGEGKSIKTAKKGSEDKQSIRKKISLRSLCSLPILDTFSAQIDKLLHQALSEKHMSTKTTQGTEAKYQDQHTHRRRSSRTDGSLGKHWRLSTSSNALNHE
jgi:hypothetical protein